MAINTILLDFSVNPSAITNKDERKLLQENVESVLLDYLPSLKFKHSLEIGDTFVSLYEADRNSLITVRTFDKGLVACNIESYKDDNEKPLLTFELTHKLEKSLREKCQGKRSHAFPAIKRGGIVDRYFPTADERILEYDIDEVLYEERSPYQKIQIVHSRSLGNLLVLDDLQNMSESDLVYTETLMQRGKESYAGKEIIILGGGDGALLWELLKENPKFVTMVEIDELVMKACRKYLRTCCGTCLDEYKTDNYEIIVEDCLKILDKFIKEGKKFDYVFGDLTDIPLSPVPQGEVWDFIRLILNTSMRVLKPNGKYMTHGNGASCPESLSMFESQLKQLSVPVQFTRDHAFVPSFMEDWIFYQVQPVPN
ncbi:spermine synthase-like isoform X1 [Schistocerca cancellata]|uniref:spermine synthase-like isoform X1 n=1 Tax=Schistocerca cancellata TaxID=274614 RepID=UPI002117CA71|nr:spermine synthase-like isoform X1 [Schistocerca cancellata]